LAVSRHEITFENSVLRRLILCVLPLFAAISVNAQEQTAAAADSQSKKNQTQSHRTRSKRTGLEDSTEIAAVRTGPRCHHGGNGATRRI